MAHASSAAHVCSAPQQYWVLHEAQAAVSYANPQLSRLAGPPLEPLDPPLPPEPLLLPAPPLLPPDPPPDDDPPPFVRASLPPLLQAALEPQARAKSTSVPMDLVRDVIVVPFTGSAPES
jgi:hypothetical protein